VEVEILANLHPVRNQVKKDIAPAHSATNLPQERTPNMAKAHQFTFPDRPGPRRQHPA
jgi:hypothetical protein